MAEAGILTERDRVELIHGRIIAMMPIGPWHSASNRKLLHTLRSLYGDRAQLSEGDPVGLSEDSEPQPDLTVLRWRDDFYAQSHPGPADVILLIEVADTSRAFDLGTKLDLYASHGIQEYWVIDGVQKCVRVFQDPKDGTYRIQKTHLPGETIALPDCDGKALAVKDTGL